MKQSCSRKGTLQLRPNKKRAELVRSVESSEESESSAADALDNKIASRGELHRPPMTDVGTETTFRLDQRKHFQKSKHLLRS